MKVYIVEGGEYEERCIIGIYSSRKGANEKKVMWDSEQCYLGARISVEKGGDGIKRYIMNEATITEWEVEE